MFFEVLRSKNEKKKPLFNFMIGKMRPVVWLVGIYTGCFPKNESSEFIKNLLFP